MLTQPKKTLASNKRLERAKRGFNETPGTPLDLPLHTYPGLPQARSGGTPVGLVTSLNSSGKAWLGSVMHVEMCQLQRVWSMSCMHM